MTPAPLGRADRPPAALAARRGIGVVRVSQEREGTTSPEVQRYAIETYAARANITIVEWVEGIDESGSRRRSKWWAKLDYAVEQVEQGRADVVVVWKYSRTARQRLKWAVALDRIDAAGGALESATEQADATPSGRFARGMLGEMNAYQAELIGETWREAHDRRRRAGLPPNGGPRYGYVLQDRVYTPHPVEAPVLAEMYRRAAAGDGFTAIAKWANRAGHLTRAGNLWSRTTVTALLDTGFAAGLIIQRPTRGEWRDHNPLHATYHPGVHEALVDEDLWARYLDRRAETPDHRRPAHGGYMLSGLVKCGECDRPMHVGANKRTDYYRCSRATGTGVGKKLSMTRALVEQGVHEWLVLYAAALDREAAAASKERPRPKPITNLAAIDALMKRNSERAAKLTIRNLDGDLPDHVYRATVAELDREHLSLQARRDEAAKPPAERPRGADVRAFLDGWDDMTPEEQNRALRPLVARVIIHHPLRQGAGVWRARIEVVPTWDEGGDEAEAVAEAARTIIQGPW